MKEMLLAIVVLFTSYQTMANNQCQGLFVNQPRNKIKEEIQALRATTLEGMSRLERGEILPSDFPITPLGYIVSFQRRILNSVILSKGRIVGAEIDVHGKINLIVQEIFYEGADLTMPVKIALDSIQKSSFNVSRKLTNAEQITAQTRIRDAFENGDFIKFEELDGNSVVRGKVFRTVYDGDRMVSVELISEFGLTIAYKVSLINPESIQSFRPEPHRLIPFEQNNLNRAYSALRNRQTVSITSSYIDQGISRNRRAVGVITAIELAVDGDHLIYINSVTSNPGRTRTVFRLSELVDLSF